MKKFLLSTLLILGAASVASAVDFPERTYNYAVRYHWGLIDETAAHASVSVQCTDDYFYGTLNGRSIDWEGRFFEVTDTLAATFGTAAPGELPSEAVTDCIGWYRKPTVDALRAGCYDADAPQNFKNTAGQGTLDADPSTMTNILTTANLLAAFYYAYSVDFDSLAPGQTLTAQCGEGMQVTAVYGGEKQWNGQPVQEFTFTYSGAGVPVRCLIDADARIPVLFKASLAIGDIEMSLC